MAPKASMPPTFFEKLYTRILSNPKYNSIVDWQPNGNLFIHNIDAFEKIVKDEWVYQGSEGYKSIGRQLRIYGFNRVLGKQFNVPGKSREKVWTHEILTSECTLEDIKAYKRRTKAKQYKWRPSKKSSKARSKTEEADDDDDDDDDNKRDEVAYTIPEMPLPYEAGEDIDLALADEIVSACRTTASNAGAARAASARQDVQRGGAPWSAQDLPIEELADWAFASPDEEDHSSGTSFDETLEDIQAVRSGSETLQTVREGIADLTQNMFVYTTQMMFVAPVEHS